MNKEELNSKISEALGGTQLTLSEKTRNDIVDSVTGLLADDAEITDDLVSKIVGMYKSMDGNLHSDVSAEVKKYKEANPQKTKEDTKPKEEPKTELEKLTALVEEQNKRLQAMEDDRKDRASKDAKDALMKQIKESLDAKFKTAKIEPNAFVLKQTLREADIPKENGDVKTLVDQIEKDYFANLKEAGLDGAGSPRFGGTGGNKGKSAVDSFFAKKAKKEGWGGEKK